MRPSFLERSLPQVRATYGDPSEPPPQYQGTLRTWEREGILDCHMGALVQAGYTRGLQRISDLREVFCVTRKKPPRRPTSAPAEQGKVRVAHGWAHPDFGLTCRLSKPDVGYGPMGGFL